MRLSEERLREPSAGSDEVELELVGETAASGVTRLEHKPPVGCRHHILILLPLDTARSREITACHDTSSGQCHTFHIPSYLDISSLASAGISLKQSELDLSSARPYCPSKGRWARAFYRPRFG